MSFHFLKKPNILLLMCDQMRGDCLGITGHPNVKTPYLDRLAGEGTLFTNAYSACPSCIPARAGLFTGLSPEHHGRVGYEDGISWDYPHMMPEELGKLGYHTECVGKLHVHPPLYRCGFHNLQLHDGCIGFYRHPGDPARLQQDRHDRYLQYLREREGVNADVTDPGLDNNSWVVRPWPYSEMSHPTNWAATKSIEFLRYRDPSEPFFLMTSFVRPHPPLDPPASYLAMYQNSELRPPVCGDWDDEEACARQGWLYDSRYGCRNAQQRQEAMAGYYACITHMDHQIGRILQALFEENLMEDTIIFFVSDHGEMLFDHSLFRKALPYQGSIHIPFLVRIGRNLLKEQQPHICTSPVELQDLLPTILEMAGGQPDFPMDGRSLIPWILEDCREPVRSVLFGEHAYGDLSSHFVVTETDKLIWFSQSGRFQYFDLQSDPGETKDLIADPTRKPRIEALKKALLQHLEGRPEGYVRSGQFQVGQAPVNSLPILQQYAAERRSS